MKSSEFITEDDYYPKEYSDPTDRSVEDLDAFVKNYVDQMLGEPHKGSGYNRGNTPYGNEVHISIPRKDPRSGAPYKAHPDWKAEWVETAEDLIDELRRNEFGEYFLDSYSQTRIQLTKENS